MDKIEDFDKENVDTTVKKAANKAMEKLKKYYQYTDRKIYTISTSILSIFFICFNVVLIFYLLVFNVIILLILF